MSLELAKQIVRYSFEGKKDKGGYPYTDHIERVANQFINHPNPSIIIAAFLHDILEDCPEWNHASLRHLFPNHIVDWVVGLTRGRSESYNDYIDRIKTIGHPVVMIKLADLRDNMDITRLKELTEKDIERLKKYHSAYLKLTT